MQIQDKNIIGALDIGTSKIICLIGKIEKDSSLKILGMGMSPSTGLKKGVVVNIEATVASIKDAVSQAQKVSGIKLSRVFAGIAGSHIKSFNSHGIVAIQNTEVTKQDIAKVIQAAKALAIPADLKILHIIPQEYAIDDQFGIKEPIGMSGIRLEAKVHIVAGSVNAIQNILKCVKKCELILQDVILEQLGSSECVLSQDEKDLGVCLVDIGGGTTDIAIFDKGSIKHTINIPLAGDQINNDIAVALKVTNKQAEEIKLKYGCAASELSSQSDKFVIKHVSGLREYEISEHALSEVIEARYEELLNIVKNEVKKYKSNYDLPAGIVITGGGSKIKGLLNLGEQILDTIVRIGSPVKIKGLEEVVDNPVYSTGVGLLQYGAKKYASSDQNEQVNILSKLYNFLKKHVF